MARFTFALLVAALAAVAVAAPVEDVNTLEKRARGKGQATWFDTETGNAGACGHMNSNSDHIVAVCLCLPATLVLLLNMLLVH